MKSRVRKNGVQNSRSPQHAAFEGGGDITNLTGTGANASENTTGEVGRLDLKGAGGTGAPRRPLCGRVVYGGCVDERATPKWLKMDVSGVLNTP